MADVSNEVIGMFNVLRARKLQAVWSGELRRNELLCEALTYGEATGQIKLEPYELEQESGYDIIWLEPLSPDHPSVRDLPTSRL